MGEVKESKKDWKFLYQSFFLSYDPLCLKGEANGQSIWQGTCKEVLGREN